MAQLDSAQTTLSAPPAIILAPPAIKVLGRAPQPGIYNGVGRALNDTPLGSTPSTASNSPKL